MEAIVDSKNDYPLAAKNAILLRAGHLVRQYRQEVMELLKHKYVKFQNEVGLSAVKVTSGEDIRSISPTKRNCYFDDEHQLQTFNKYSQVTHKYFLFKE